MCFYYYNDVLYNMRLCMKTKKARNFLSTNHESLSNNSSV